MGVCTFRMGIVSMASLIDDILRSFDALPEAAKREVAVEILRRSVQLDVQPLTDEELVSAAEGLFLQLDQDESADD